MASSSAGPSMSTLSAAPFTSSPPFTQQHARTTRKPLRSSPLAGPVLSRSPSPSRMQSESKVSTPPALSEAERMIALNVHGAFDSRDALKATFLEPPRPVHIRGSHSRSLQEISRLRPRPVSLYSAPGPGRNTLRNHRRSFLGLDAERARAAEEETLRQGTRGLSALGETDGQDEDLAHEVSEEDWGHGQAEVEAKYNSDHNSFSMKATTSSSRMDMKSSTTRPRPKSILLNPPSTSALSQSMYSYSPSHSPSPSRSSFSSLPTSPNSTSTSLSVYPASPRSSSSFLSLPPTSPTGDAVWLTQNTYNETPKFTRLGLGAPGVVMPVSAKAKVHSKPLKTLSPPTPAPIATGNAVAEPQARAPATSATLSKRNSFIVTLSASLGRPRSLSASDAMSQIAEDGQQQAGHTPRNSSHATQVSGNDGDIHSCHGTPHVLADPNNKAKRSPASNSSPHTSVITQPVHAPSGAGPPTSSESSSPLSLVPSNSQSPSQKSSESSATCSSLPSSPTPSLTRSGSASSSASSLPIHTPPPEAEGDTVPSSSHSKEIIHIEEDTRHLSSEPIAVTITDVDVARALENAQRAEALNNNMGSSRRRSRLGLGLGRGLERVKSWTSSPPLVKNAESIPRNADMTVNAIVSTSTSSPPPATPPVHSLPPKSSAVDGATKALAGSHCSSVVATTASLTSVSCASATGLQSVPATNAPPPPVPAGEVPSSNSHSDAGPGDTESERPFSEALVEASESLAAKEEACGNEELDKALCTGGKTSFAVAEPLRAENGNRPQQQGGSDSCHVRARSWSSHNLLRLTPSSGRDKKKLANIPRSQSETAILVLPLKAIQVEEDKNTKKADLSKSEKGHERRSSVRRMWDALVHRDSTKRNGSS